MSRYNQTVLQKANVDNKQCVGCFACSNICPKKCITMRDDICTGDIGTTEWFYYPWIDEDQCIDCKQCERVCPAVHPQYNNKKKPEIFIAAASDNIRKISTSGGVYAVLASWILSQGGTVFGSDFDEDFNLITKRADTLEGALMFCGSKYVQGFVGETYKDVRYELEKNTPVLFTGTPCQVAGLYGFLGKEYSSLYTMDFICHGVPSGKMFREYLCEIGGEKRPAEVRFRDKRHGWNNRNLYFDAMFEDGYNYSVGDSEDIWFKAFLDSPIFDRASCGDCPFAHIPRQGDVTVGDAWRVELFSPKDYDTRGLSWLSVNNAKGQRLLSEVKKEFQILKKEDIKNIKKYNHIFYTAKPASQDRARFFHLKERHSIRESVTYARDTKWDVVLASNFCGPNYGTLLTHNCLYHVLKNMGLEVCMVENVGVNRSLAPVVNEFVSEAYDYFDVRDGINTYYQLRETNKLADTFIVGSDQVWQTKPFFSGNAFSGLEFVDDGKRKISYATSFGRGDRFHGNEEQRRLMQYYFRRFDRISVREKSGIDILNDFFDIEAEWVLDPILLVGRNYFDEIRSGVTKTNGGKYIFAYMLEPNGNKEGIVVELCRKLQMPSINATFGYGNPQRSAGWELETEEQLSVKDFVATLADSDFVVTDSFHATCIAILYHKQFISIEHETRSSDRVQSLLELTGLSERLKKQPTETKDLDIIEKDIDYEKVDNILNQERIRSRRWLQDSINITKKHTVSDFDVIRWKIDSSHKDKEVKHIPIIRRVVRVVKTEGLKGIAVRMRKKLEK